MCVYGSECAQCECGGQKPTSGIFCLFEQGLLPPGDFVTLSRLANVFLGFHLPLPLISFIAEITGVYHRRLYFFNMGLWNQNSDPWFSFLCAFSKHCHSAGGR